MHSQFYVLTWLFTNLSIQRTALKCAYASFTFSRRSASNANLLQTHLPDYIGLDDFKYLCFTHFPVISTYFQMKLLLICNYQKNKA